MSRRKLDLKVEPGAIRLASISLLAYNKDIIALDIDCNSKYPEVWVSSGDITEEIILSKDERTLRCSELKNPTRIVLPKPPGDWNIFLNTGKYLVSVRLLRRKKTQSRVGFDDDDKKLLLISL